MERYTVHDAQDHLQQLIDDARQGKTVLILDEHEQAVQLMPIPTPRKTRKAGSARGQAKMSLDFAAPLADFDAYLK